MVVGSHDGVRVTGEGEGIRDLGCQPWMLDCTVGSPASDVMAKVTSFFGCVDGEEREAGDPVVDGTCASGGGSHIVVWCPILVVAGLVSWYLGVVRMRLRDRRRAPRC